MSGSTTTNAGGPTATVPGGTAFSALPQQSTPPSSGDGFLGVFGGQFQFLTAQQAWAGAVPIAGGVSLTGALSGITPTAPAHLTTKAYVDTAISSVTGAASQAAGQAQVSATNAANAAEGAANAATLAVTAKIGKAGGAAALSPAGNLMLGTVEFLGVSSSGLPLLIIDVPDSDPGVANALWNNGGALWLSPGAST